MSSTSRLYLSPPHMGPAERDLLLEAFDSNWVAPLGPHVDAFQQEFAAYVGMPRAVALSSGTAALHLALIALGVGRGDDVLVSSLTFAGSVNPILYVGATPILVDCESTSWNIDPNLLEDYLTKAAARGKLPKAIMPVHLYGQVADMEPILALGRKYGIPVVEDAAEALGATYRGSNSGSMGELNIFSFNGNKIITTSGGGMVVGSNTKLLDHILKLATQAREPAPHYEHKEVGYNYRLSNLLAAVGRGQLQVLESRIAARRRIFEWYTELLAGVSGIVLQPDAGWGRHTRWLTTVQVDPAVFGVDREQLRLALEKQNIESRPFWKPMHLQPVFADAPQVINGTSERLFENGLCLPSGSAMTRADAERVVISMLRFRDAAGQMR
jgi:dTDP-4-amino-4,6-dideoxygalactose transaminase